MSLVAGPGRGGGSHNDANMHSSPPLPTELTLAIDKHISYIQSLDTRRDELEYWLTEHLRLNGLYWGLTAAHLLGAPSALNRSDVIAFVLSCLHDNGGFGAAPGHDAHMLYTVSAVQILVTLDAVGELDSRLEGGKLKVGQFIASLQDPHTGTFTGDATQPPDPDTRFLYAALNALSLLSLLDLINQPLILTHLSQCCNPDGAYGVGPGSESHAGQTFACVGALAILDRLDLLPGGTPDKVAAWLSERQLPNGGLNGRPEKLEDVCYSWWVVSSLAMIGRTHWIDGVKLANFILTCQDPERGGFADRPGDMVDVFHTVFGVAGLSLLGFPGLEDVDPRYCMPESVTRRVLGESV